VSGHSRVAWFVGVVALLLVSDAAARAAAPPGDAPNCAAPLALTALGAALDRTGALIAEGKSLTILAMGSSSTLGVGASSPAMSYPSRLERALSEAFPAVEINVVNHGRGGQDVREELSRLSRDIVVEHPDLVIWQVGTNAVLRRDDLAADGQLIERAVDAIRQAGIDVVLMDLQYAPRVLARRAWPEMERLIAGIAERAHVGSFRRFEIMREWDRTRQLAPAALIGRDGLHMTDVSYNCLADQLSHSLAEQWRGYGKLAKSTHSRPDAAAGGGRGVIKVAR
jgi:acyl-CoA thioesterase I